MPQVRYVLWPGKMTSKWDGQEHYISYYQLAQLYDLSIKACCDGSALDHQVRPTDINLAPRYDGDYIAERQRQERAASAVAVGLRAGRP